jgi:prepilin-type N-terminal cleavage/methylation domain-containing protein
MRGFSFVEVLVSILILGVVIAGICAVLNIGNIAWHTDMGLVDLQQEVRQAMDGMAREIRQAKIEQDRPLNISDEGKKIEFYIPTYNKITYFLQDNQIIREYAGETKVLANDISDLCFCWDKTNGICKTDCSGFFTIRMQADKQAISGPLSFSLIEEVGLRNE